MGLHLRGLAWLCAGLVAATAVAAEIPGPALTNCVQVLRLTPEEAKRSQPAQVTGVVTCYVPESGLLFVQDDSAGLYIFPKNWSEKFELGTVVTVEGVTDSGRFSPIITASRITPTGERREVPARRITIEELNSGRFDAQKIELSGVVQSARPLANGLSLRLAVGSTVAHVLFFADRSAARLLDARIRLEGVAGTFYSGDTLSGFGLFVPPGGKWEILNPAAADLSQLPLRPLEKLAWFSPEGAMDQRIRVRGVVTAAWSDKTLYIQEGSAALKILTESPAKFEPGDQVEAAGYLRHGPAGYSLIQGVVTKLGSQSPLPPANRAGRELLQQPPNGLTVSVDGQVTALRSRTNNLAELWIETSTGSISALLRGDVPGEWLHSQVRAAGVWSAAPDRADGSGDSALLIPSPSHVTVLFSAPVPATGGLKPLHSALLAGGCATVCAWFAFWAWRARHGSKMAYQLATEFRIRTLEAERVASRLEQDRERLSRDLHDHIIQSIYAVGLKLDESSRTLVTTPEVAAARVRSLLGEINSVIRELRGLVLGLESSAIQPQEFRTALKSLALTLGQEKNGLVLNLDQSAVDQLTPAQATELVHIAREGLSNSVRHGRAQMMRLSLHETEDALSFSLEDDGCGFNPGAIETKGFGLRNMAKRAESIGAKWSLFSEPGHGARFLLDIPKQRHHS